MAKNAHSVLSMLERSGLLLLSDYKLPSLTSLVAGAPIKGSWWGHPKGTAIFQEAERLLDHPDVIAVKLVAGKVTFVHRLLWPHLLTLARSREQWKTRGLSSRAACLLAEVERAGLVEQPDDRRAAAELESRLLVYAEQYHTVRGSHAKRLLSWTQWVKRNKIKTGRVAVSAARDAFKAAMDARYPWEEK